MRALFILLTLAAPTGAICGPGYLELVPEIVDYFQPLACRESTVRRGCTTLLIDVESFVKAGRSFTSDSLGRAEVLAAIPGPFKDLPAERAYDCSAKVYPCERLHRGTHVQLDSVVQTSWGVEAFVTYSYAPSSRGPVVRNGFTRMAFRYVVKDGRWVFWGQRLLFAI